MTEQEALEYIKKHGLTLDYSNNKDGQVRVSKVTNTGLESIGASGSTISEATESFRKLLASFTGTTISTEQKENAREIIKRMQKNISELKKDFK